MGLETPTTTIDWLAGIDALAITAATLGLIGLTIVAVYTIRCFTNDNIDVYNRNITIIAAVSFPLFFVGLFFSFSILQVSA